jgi:hypothetical protein
MFLILFLLSWPFFEQDVVTGSLVMELRGIEVFGVAKVG